ncbi:hypothetical protein C4J81_16440 [Deltaproteobacteria bacterium Smac51]|nr:hypothetical protein C4J81_16440 [Deltaproteobacteria bacterium Smac51]
MGDTEIKDLKSQLGTIYDRLTRIETKLSERCDARCTQIDNLEKRVRQLEYDKYKVIGAAALLSVLASNLLKFMG